MPTLESTAVTARQVAKALEAALEAYPEQRACQIIENALAAHNGINIDAFYAPDDRLVMALRYYTNLTRPPIRPTGHD